MNRGTRFQKGKKAHICSSECALTPQHKAGSARVLSKRQPRAEQHHRGSSNFRVRQGQNGRQAVPMADTFCICRMGTIMSAIYLSPEWLTWVTGYQAPNPAQHTQKTQGYAAACYIQTLNMLAHRISFASTLISESTKAQFPNRHTSNSWRKLHPEASFSSLSRPVRKDLQACPMASAQTCEQMATTTYHQ